MLNRKFQFCLFVNSLEYNMVTIHFQALFLVLMIGTIQGNQPVDPRLIIFGQTRADKIRMANFLLGSPLSSDERLTKTQTCILKDFCGFEASG